MMRLPTHVHRWVPALALLLGLGATLDWSVRAGMPALAETASALEPTLDRMAELPRMRSMLVSVDGRLVAEQYYNGASARRAANIKSASKSVISALVGIALDRGDIAGLETPVGEYFPEYLDDPDKAAITVEDLLTMRAGLETTSNRNYGRWVQSGNWVRHALTRPLVARPGTRMIYSTGSTHLLSAIITRASGVDTHTFARRHLGEPLGISVPRWTTDPQGIYFGGNEMSLTPRAMVEIGELYLNCGRVGVEQVISEEYVHQSVEAHAFRARTPDRAYGYGWWVREFAGYDAFYAWGYGGQFIYVVPQLRLVTVMTSSPNPGSGLRDHRRSLYRLMEREIVPTVARGL